MCDVGGGGGGGVQKHKGLQFWRPKRLYLLVTGGHYNVCCLVN